MRKAWGEYHRSIHNILLPENSRLLADMKVAVEKAKIVNIRLAKLNKVLSLLEALCKIKKIKLTEGDSFFEPISFYNKTILKMQGDIKGGKHQTQYFIDEYFTDDWTKKIQSMIDVSSNKLEKLLQIHSELFENLPKELRLIESRFKKIKSQKNSLQKLNVAQEELKKIEIALSNLKKESFIDDISRVLNVDTVTNLKRKVLNASSAINKIEFNIKHKKALEDQAKDKQIAQEERVREEAKYQKALEDQAKDKQIAQEERAREEGRAREEAKYQKALEDQAKDKQIAQEKRAKEKAGSESKNYFSSTAHTKREKKESNIKLISILVCILIFLIIFFAWFYIKPEIKFGTKNLSGDYNILKKHINSQEIKNNAQDATMATFAEFDLNSAIQKYKFKDYDGAREIFLVGADFNDPIALNYLGRLYENGFGVEKNYEQAKSFYERSSRLGNEKAKKNLEHIQSLLVIQEDKLRNAELSQTLKSLAKLDEINTSSKSRADKSQNQEETVPSEYRNLLGHFIIPARFNYAVDNSFILDLLSDGQIIIKANNNLEQFGNIDWGSLEASYPAPDQTYFSYIVYFNSKGNNSKGFKIETKRRNYKNNLIEVETSFHTKLKIFIIFDGPQKYIMRVEGESWRRNGEFSPLFW